MTNRSPKPRRPEADTTCAITRTVTRNGMRLDVWTCGAPAPTEEGPTGDLWVAPLVVFERIGRRKWKFFFVDPANARREDAEYSEPGWYFEAVNPDPSWMSNGPVGPYKTLDDARDDLRLGCSAE